MVPSIKFAVAEVSCAARCVRRPWSARLVYETWYVLVSERLTWMVRRVREGGRDEGVDLHTACRSPYATTVVSAPLSDWKQFVFRRHPVLFRQFLKTALRCGCRLIMAVSHCYIREVDFYRATAKHTHGLPIDICLSVCLSVCQTRVLWQNEIIIVCKCMNTYDRAMFRVSWG